MTNVDKYLIPVSSSILEAIRIITENSTQFGIVVSAENKLEGVVTDGDIRAGILKGVDLKESVTLIMNKEPKTIHIDENDKSIHKLVRKFKIRHIPIVDKEMKVKQVFDASESLMEGQKENPVVIMAGGLGSRLGDLTSNCPKPLLKVGDKPILETILENFIEHGFNNFFFSVNYMSEQIESFFKDGSDWGVNISYIKETKKLGTAGALGLLSVKSNLPIIIMNGDLLTKVNFSELLQFHSMKGSDGTMCVRKYDFQVPYGVVETSNSSIIRILEKPVQEFFVNAGIYILEKSMLELIDANTHMDMTTLFESAQSKNKSLNVFPIHEYWLDIGRIEDFEKAQSDFHKIFG